MFETIVLATDGSASVERAVAMAVDLADRFDATLHALYVVDRDDVEAAPASLRDSIEDGLREEGEEVLTALAERTDVDVQPTIRTGRPTVEIVAFAEEVEADVVAIGTRGRHGEHRYLLGSVAEAVVRRCPIPVLAVRQLAANESTSS